MERTGVVKSMVVKAIGDLVAVYSLVAVVPGFIAELQQKVTQPFTGKFNVFSSL